MNIKINPLPDTRTTYNWDYVQTHPGLYYVAGTDRSAVFNCLNLRLMCGTLGSAFFAITDPGSGFPNLQYYRIDNPNFTISPAGLKNNNTYPTSPSRPPFSRLPNGTVIKWYHGNYGMIYVVKYGDVLYEIGKHEYKWSGYIDYMDTMEVLGTLSVE